MESNSPYTLPTHPALGEQDGLLEASPTIIPGDNSLFPTCHGVAPSSHSFPSATRSSGREPRARSNSRATDRRLRAPPRDPPLRVRGTGAPRSRGHGVMSPPPPPPSYPRGAAKCPGARGGTAPPFSSGVVPSGGDDRSRTRFLHEVSAVRREGGWLRARTHVMAAGVVNRGFVCGAHLSPPPSAGDCCRRRVGASLTEPGEGKPSVRRNRRKLLLSLPLALLESPVSPVWGSREHWGGAARESLPLGCFILFTLFIILFFFLSPRCVAGVTAASGGER